MPAGTLHLLLFLMLCVSRGAAIVTNTLPGNVLVKLRVQRCSSGLVGL